MKRVPSICFCGVCVLLWLSAGLDAQSFIRGDANGDLKVDFSDVAYLGQYFAGTAPAPLDCNQQPKLDSGDINDNEHFTLADLLLLGEHLACGATRPPPDACGRDPDGNTQGFDVVDPTYSAFAAAEITSLDVELLLQVSPPAATSLKTATLVVAFDPAVMVPVLSQQNPRFLPAQGVQLVLSRLDQNRVILAVQPDPGGCGAALPTPDPATNRIDLGRLSFQNHSGADCAAIMASTSLVPQHTLGVGNGLTYRASVVSADFADHHPALSPLTCTVGEAFIRGDANGDLKVDFSDVAYLGQYFAGTAPAPLDCNQQPKLDSGDINDNEHFTLADLLLLGEYLACGATRPPPDTCGPDPDGNTQGFDVVDGTYGVFATAAITSGEVLLLLQASLPPATTANAATLVLEFDPAVLRPALNPQQDVCFVAARGVEGLLSRLDGNRVVVAVRPDPSGCGSNLPSPDPVTNLIDLGKLSFQNIGSADCATIMASTSLEPEHTLSVGNGLTYRATVVTADYADHHPALAPLSCAAGVEFLRGDANLDSDVDISDPIHILNRLFSGGPVFCRDAEDGNDDGDVDISDPPYILDYLFRGGSPLLAPAGTCGPDPTADCLDCERHVCP